jgi:predicted Zn-dependent protease
VGDGHCIRLFVALPVPISVLADTLGWRVARDHTSVRCSNLMFKLRAGQGLEAEFMDRIAWLTEVLAQNPTDAFARYGLAMEYSNSGEVERALEEFGRLLASHPDYTAGYFMAAQTLAKAERTEEARKMLVDGIASAKKTGNGHAQSEMEGMLAELE